MGNFWDDPLGEIGKGVVQVASASFDPFNITGYGGIPGVNSDGRNLSDLVTDVKGDISGQPATDRALAEQRAGAAQATNSITDAYKQQRTDLQPYQQAGGTALSSLAGNDFMKNYQQDPGYQFRLAEGNKAINAAAAARGMGNSGATMKALTRYGQDYATNDYNNVYNREYQRLSGLAGMGGNTAGQLSNAAGQYGANLAGVQTGLANANASANIASANRQSGLLGSAMTAGAMAFSDKRLKKDIKRISPQEIYEMKSKLQPYRFNYKDESHGKGEWIGVMAQDLEKSKLGSTIVFENEKGEKQIDIKKAVSLLLALFAEGYCDGGN